MAQWVGQQGSEAVVPGSNTSLYLHYLTLIMRQKMVIPPFFCLKIFDALIFLKRRRVPLRNFLVL